MIALVAGENVTSARSAIRGVNVALIPFTPNAQHMSADKVIALNVERIGAARMAGFNFVRLGVPVAAWVAASSTGPNVQWILEVTTGTVRAVLQQGMLLNMALFLPSARKVVCESSGRTTYLTALTALLAVVPNESSAAIEVMNEPASCTTQQIEHTSDWSEYQTELYQLVRKRLSKATYVVTGSAWGSADGLVQLNPTPYRNDSNIIYSFHYYEPMLFTHQQIGWLRPDHVNQYVHDLQWPVNKLNALKVENTAVSELLRASQSGTSDRLAKSNLVSLFNDYRETGRAPHVSERFQSVYDWAIKHGVNPDQLLLEEFGVHRRVVYDQSVGEVLPTAPAWIRAVREESEKLRIGWVVWDLDSGFGVLCSARNGASKLCTPYRDALGLQ